MVVQIKFWFMLPAPSTEVDRSRACEKSQVVYLDTVVEHRDRIVDRRILLLLQMNLHLLDRMDSVLDRSQCTYLVSFNYFRRRTRESMGQHGDLGILFESA